MEHISFATKVRREPAAVEPMKIVIDEDKWRCDITAHTVLLYVLFCLICMYCTLYVLYIPHTVHTVHVPCFPVSDVEVSSSTSVHTLVHTIISSLVYSLITCAHTAFILTKLFSSA